MRRAQTQIHRPAERPHRSLVVNDIHSRLNPTVVGDVVRVGSLADVQETIRWAVVAGKAVSVAGGRHAMGGQQFGRETVLLDTRPLNRVLNFDSDTGTVKVEAGAMWPELIATLIETQGGSPRQWGIAQKQTGADRLSLGGAVSANIHGRGLAMKPLVGDIESLEIVDAAGDLVTCSRIDNAELFRLVVGGYGLFGIVYSVTLRLCPRRKVRRVVELGDTGGLMSAFERRVRDGFLYGDFQFCTDASSYDFLRKGVFSCYRPVDDETPIPMDQHELSESDWFDLAWLAHVDKAEAYRRYVAHYRATDGQVYWSDTHQLAPYLDDYHRDLDRRTGAVHPASEMISELYVPRETFTIMMERMRDDFLRNRVDLIYGTVRAIERDDETFLPWARERWACIVINLHVEHTAAEIDRNAATFRRLIDTASDLGGTYYLTYHRYATPEQVERCYPKLGEWLRLKRHYDPHERFQTDWYRSLPGVRP